MNGESVRYLSEPLWKCENTDSTSVDHCHIKGVEMALRISPLWWPVLAVTSPILVPMLMLRNRVFKDNRAKATELNRSRIGNAAKLALPSLEFLEITVISDSKTREGYQGEPGVSYLITSDQGSLLFDVGFGPEKPTVAHNASKLGVRLEEVDALAISHLHADHMGGVAAAKSGRVMLPSELGEPSGKPCYLPDSAIAEGFAAEVVTRPRLLAAGIATTGPLARSLFFLGFCEEQALIANLRDRGIVIITGCGHPTIETILEMLRHISDEPVYAVAGGLHFPVTESRFRSGGIQLQMLMGTGKPPWQRIRDEDLEQTIIHINKAAPKRVLLSAHDTCDHALERLCGELNAETAVLEAGASYRLLPHASPTS